MSNSEIAKKLKVAAYIRYSMDESNFDVWIKEFKEMAQSFQCSELVKVYQDRGKSGRTIEGRDGLKQMLDDCENGKIDLILVRSTSQLFRDTLLMLRCLERLRELGISIHFQSNNLHFYPDGNELLMIMCGAMREFDKKIFAESEGVRRQGE